MAVIYKATNLLNGKAYIGYTNQFDRRKKAHLRCKADTHFHRALRKYGADKFVWSILKEDATMEDETAFIVSHETFGKGYNECIGNVLTTTLGYKHKEKTLKLISENTKAGMDDTVRMKISEKASNRVWSEETKRKISEAKLGVKKSPEARLKMSIAKRTMSDETKAKMAAAKIGRVHSEETKRKIALGNKGKKKKKRINGEQITSQA